MTAINTIEDLIKVLDENPEWVESLRVRLLSRELLELPDKFAKLSAVVEELTAEVRGFIAEVRGGIEEQKALNAYFKGAIDELKGFVEEQRALNAYFKGAIDELKGFVEEQKALNAYFKGAIDELKGFVEEQKALNAYFKEVIDELKGFVEEQKVLNAEFKRSIDELKASNDDLKRSIDELKASDADLIRRVDRLEADVKGIRDDLGPLKGAHARNTAYGEAMLIAGDLGFKFVRIAGLEDLVSLTQGNNADGIPANHIRSFQRADLVIEAQDREGRDCYLAVEVSYTVDERDSARALRNAGFLTRFTGRPAYGVVAGLRCDQRVFPSIESGELLWYGMDAESLETE